MILLLLLSCGFVRIVAVMKRVFTTFYIDDASYLLID